MALKASDSFFRFVTMGAATALRAIEVLRGLGFEAHELERYSTSNKIWQTKIKRLRLPDVFCIRTGARFEVRGKSNLEIKMSDSPTVQGREWDAGLRDEDVILYVRCDWVDGRAVPSDQLEAFTVSELRRSVGASKLGPPKSASEGAERDRSWPSVVAKSDGMVREISDAKLKTQLDTGRPQTYQLARKVDGDRVHLTTYVSEGDRFYGGTQFLAGTPARKAELIPGRDWDAIKDLGSDPLSRFAAIKALGLRGAAEHADRVHDVATSDHDARTRLEAAGSLLRFEDARAIDLLLATFNDPPRSDLRMESVLIAGEVGSSQAAEFLRHAATSETAAADEELLSAVIWSLGFKGCRNHEVVLDYLGHESDLVAAHAAVALGEVIPDPIVDRLFDALAAGGREAASAAWVLERADGVVPRLIEHARGDTATRHWAVAVLGKRPRAEVEGHADEGLRAALEPWWTENWLAEEEAADLIRFVRKQTL